ncbi:MAG TPA: PP2C family protein-serine/threonine phosphatase [Ilumatobacteraceae bacterium]|nr:PP2C family protein-serine/threonine phosphatase [Ilumatobacteraceae bacterium]
MSDHVNGDVARMVQRSIRTSPSEVLGLLGVMCDLLGARAARFHVADYSLRRLQQIDASGSKGVPQPIAGTLIGRVFTSDEILVHGTHPTVVSVPLIDGSSRIGVLELDFETWDGVVPDLLEPLVATFVMSWIVKSRYTDTAARARRFEPLSPAAEVQWDLLPPLSCSSERVAVSGILEPAYAIGGDSFDYAFDSTRVDFAMVDAIGHGMAAVLMSAAAINSLRNSRRANRDLATAYEIADTSISAQFGHSYFVTAIIGSLDLQTNTLRWINAGHVLPMLVRNGSYTGPLRCKPSRPLGLGGPVVEVAEQEIQSGDRVLFYTDGITEARSSDGTFFGAERLADFLVRASLERLPANQTVRHLADNILEFADVGLRDDATMLLVEYDPPPS